MLQLPVHCHDPFRLTGRSLIFDTLCGRRSRALTSATRCTARRRTSFASTSSRAATCHRWVPWPTPPAALVSASRYALIRDLSDYKRCGVYASMSMVSVSQIACAGCLLSNSSIVWRLGHFHIFLAVSCPMPTLHTRYGASPDWPSKMTCTPSVSENDPSTVAFCVPMAAKIGLHMRNAAHSPSQIR